MTEIKTAQAGSTDSPQSLYFEKLMSCIELCDTQEVYQIKNEELKTCQSEFDIKDYSIEESEIEVASESEQLNLPQDPVDQQKVVSQQWALKFRRSGKLSEY